ncbi:MAG: NAD(P)/FAD-dependent oxidoreductase [Bacteroidota bacterium]
MVYDIIIIGAGPAGLFAAAHCQSKSLLLLEKNQRAGRKLLIAGSGRCNLTHKCDIRDFFDHYGNNSRFLKTALLGFTNDQLLSFFENHQLKTYTDKNQKVFPDSDKSTDVLQILLDACTANGIILRSGQAVSEVKHKEGVFVVKTDNQEYSGRNLIIATGGLSYPKTGSTGDGYTFARQLGHSINKPKPALTPVFINNFSMSELSGVTLPNVTVYLYRENKKVNEHSGDIVITHKGLSGPGILDFSRYFENGDQLKINFTRVNLEVFRAEFMSMAEKEGKILLKTFLKKYDIPNSLIEFLLTSLGIDAGQNMASINKQQRNHIIQAFTEYPLPIAHVGGYDMAMVTTGGVSLSEVSSKTMESKIVPGLFFAGELLDIDGDTGGYNLQAAFSTAYLAAQSINSRMYRAL